MYSTVQSTVHTCMAGTGLRGLLVTRSDRGRPFRAWGGTDDAPFTPRENSQKFTV